MYNFSFALKSIYFLSFLQNEGVLPSAKFLIDNLQPDGDESAIVDGWECGFNHDLTKWNQPFNKKTPLELLKGFFEFYANFDYDNSVISPYAGAPIAKQDFNLPNEDNEILRAYWLGQKNNENALDS